MARYRGNDEVDAGIYLNLRELTFKPLEEAGRLPGDERAVWRRVPALVLLVGAPLVGLVYVMFLPLVGFLMLGAVATRWVAGHLAAALEATVRVMRPAWQPALAFLGRAKARGKGDEAEPGPADAWAEAVRQEVAEDVAPEEEET